MEWEFHQKFSIETQLLERASTQEVSLELTPSIQMSLLATLSQSEKQQVAIWFPSIMRISEPSLDMPERKQEDVHNKTCASKLAVFCFHFLYRPASREYLNDSKISIAIFTGFHSARQFGGKSMATSR